MALMVTEAYSPAEQKVFLDGHASAWTPPCARRTSVHSWQATPAQRLALLEELDHEQKRVMQAIETSRVGTTEEGRQGAPYFRMMKELALLGFFTSKTGYTQVLRYLETPGRYDPCVPYTAGEPAWALHA